MSKKWLELLGAVLLALGIAGGAMADVKVVQKSVTESTVAGKSQPPREGRSVSWVGRDRLRVDTGETTVIVRLDLGKVWLVNHQKKTFTEIPIPVDILKYVPAEMRQMMAAMMQFQAKVTPTNETKKVGKWTARRYDVTVSSPMMEMHQTLWATKEIPVDFSAYARMARQMMALQPGMKAFADEMAKIDGYVVLQEGTVTTMGSTVTTREVVESVEQATPAAGWYDPPDGYTREKFDPMQMMRHGR